MPGDLRPPPCHIGQLGNLPAVLVSAALQALKIIRYTSRLIAAVSPPGSEQRKRFEALQASVGTSRWVEGR